MLEQCTVPPASLPHLLSHLALWSSAQWLLESTRGAPSSASTSALAAAAPPLHMLETLHCAGGRACLFPVAVAVCLRGDALAGHCQLRLASALQCTASALVKSHVEALGQSHAAERGGGSPWPSTALLLRAGKQLTQAFHAQRVGWEWGG